MLYNSTPQNTGGFQPVRSTGEGYVNLSQNLPWYAGRSRVASIPEYQRNPWQLGDDLVMRIEEGRAHLMKLLFEYAAKNGRVTRPDVKFRWKVEIVPHQRFYLKQAAFTVSGNKTKFKLTDYTRPTQSYPPKTSGNVQQVGNIARIEAGDYLLCMFSWVEKGRTTTAPQYGKGSTQYPVPEICKVLSVDYSANELIVERNWAGAQRTGSANVTTTVTVVANTATPGSNEVKAKDAFFMLLPNSMPEDEIDAKVYGLTMTWQEGLMQRSLEPWGSGHLSEIINRNLGNASPAQKNRRQAIEDFYKKMELAALWGEKDEGWDVETQDWWGLTDGLLTNIPKSHYIGIVPPTYTNIRTRSEKAWGSFDIPIFNKILEDKAYMGSQNKIALCGADGYTAFSTMINYMTQNIPEIKSDWKVVGRRFQSSGGLTVDFIPSDTMTLNGMRNKIILFDPSVFKLVNLEGYPIDIVEIQNENPLKKNGFIHGVYAFMDMNPDAHWVFTLDQTLASATLSSYTSYLMGVEHA